MDSRIQRTFIRQNKHIDKHLNKSGNITCVHVPVFMCLCSFTCVDDKKKSCRCESPIAGKIGSVPFTASHFSYACYQRNIDNVLTNYNVYYFESYNMHDHYLR